MMAKIFVSLLLFLLCLSCLRNEIVKNLHKKKDKKIFAAIDPNFEVAYLKLHKSSELKKRAEKL